MIMVLFAITSLALRVPVCARSVSPFVASDCDDVTRSHVVWEVLADLETKLCFHEPGMEGGSGREREGCVERGAGLTSVASQPPPPPAKGWRRGFRRFSAVSTELILAVREALYRGAWPG